MTRVRRFRYSVPVPQEKTVADKSCGTDDDVELGKEFLRRSLELGKKKDGCAGCIQCMSRIPYATLIATIMCCVGVGVFCGTLYRGITLTFLMIQDVFYFEVGWLDAVQTVFIIVGAIMGGLGLVILLVGFLATGSTREKVYKRWKARLGGRISCAILMAITYVLHLIWLTMFICLIIITMGYTIAWSLCNNKKYTATTDSSGASSRCIDFAQFDFLFPNTTNPDVMKVCGPGRLKLFCKDYVEPASIMLVLASVSSILVILSLVHYLMCLAANYAHIKNSKNLEDLHLYELQYLRETEA